jgi:diaminopimelate epimerase
VKFAKAHGLGNDFLLIAADEAPRDAARWARRLCERHTGIGADGVLLYGPAPGGSSMLLINADGSDAEISGNGLRCLAAFAVSKRLAEAEHTVQTAAGPRKVEVAALGGGAYRVVTDLGKPLLATHEIPVALEPGRAPVVDHPLVVLGRTLHITATSLGNPHCALFLDAPVEDALLEELGPALETHALFPQRTNVEFVTVVSASELRVRFWERGVGYTRASGTGAASAAVAAMLKKRTGRSVRVACDGGVLEVAWPEAGSVRQTGNVELLFEGEWTATAS